MGSGTPRLCLAFSLRRALRVAGVPMLMHWRDEGGQLLRYEFVHRGVFTAGFFDSVERQTQAQWAGVAAHQPCGYCRMQTTAAGNFRYLLGYNEPAPQPRVFPGGETLELLANDARLLISAECGRAGARRCMKAHRQHCPGRW